MLSRALACGVAGVVMAAALPLVSAPASVAVSAGAAPTSVRANAVAGRTSIVVTGAARRVAGNRVRLVLRTNGTVVRVWYFAPSRRQVIVRTRHGVGQAALPRATTRIAIIALSPRGRSAFRSVAVPRIVPTPVPVQAPTFPSMSQTILRLVNQARSVGRACGAALMPKVGPVKLNAQLNLAAQRHAADMASRNYFNHTNPDGKSPFDRMQDAGYRFSSAGENIAAGYPDAQAVMAGWLASPGHCRNIMGASYTELGVGYTDRPGSDYRTYWVQNFGSPR